MINVIVLIVFIILVFLYNLLSKPKIVFEKFPWGRWIGCFIAHTFLMAFFFGTPATFLVLDFLNLYDLSGIQDFLVCWIWILIGWFFLSQWFGLILSRYKVVWYSDYKELS